MKTMIHLSKTFFIVSVFALSILSCDDDNTNKNIPQTIQNALSSQFSPTGIVDWDIKSVGYTADFISNGQKTKAWFERSGALLMTEIDVPYASLPAAVRASHDSSKYSTWRKEDVEKVIRPNLETIYIIEVESGETEVDLYYSEAGILIKAITDIDNDDDDRFESLLPQQMPATITAIIEEKYPNARIAEIDVERNGIIEVDIIDGNISRELWFDKEHTWLQTSWDVRYNALPQPVKDVITGESGYEFDDAEFVETPTTTYYQIELDGRPDKTIKVTAEGEIL